MVSQVEVLNNALISIGQGPVNSLDEPTESSRIGSLVFEASLRELLSLKNWNFATLRVELAKDDGEPPGFPLPRDYIHMLCVASDYYQESYYIENGRIVIADDGPLPVVYISYMDDTNKMPPLFLEALYRKIALRLVDYFAYSQSRIAELQQRFNNALVDASHRNSTESSPDTYRVRGWSEARWQGYRGSYGRGYGGTPYNRRVSFE